MDKKMTVKVDGRIHKLEVAGPFVVNTVEGCYSVRLDGKDVSSALSLFGANEQMKTIKQKLERGY